MVPFFHKAGVYTAYEYLERRFDAKTRALASLLFLLSRGLSAGVIIAAPAVILSIVLGWSLPLTILAIGIPTTAYTMFGGVQAVASLPDSRFTRSTRCTLQYSVGSVPSIKRALTRLGQCSLGK